MYIINNNIPKVISQVGSGDDRVYIDLKPTLEAWAPSMFSHIGGKH